MYQGSGTYVDAHQGARSAESEKARVSDMIRGHTFPLPSAKQGQTMVRVRDRVRDREGCMRVHADWAEGQG